MRLTSSAFEDSGTLPARYSCDGGGAVPPLSWSDVPVGTQSLALVLHDPDAPGGSGFTHWVVYDIPPDASVPVGTDGANSAGDAGYTPPCPPSGTHRYVFTLYALDAVLGLPEGADRDAVVAAADGHVLAVAGLTATYGRGGIAGRPE